MWDLSSLKIKDTFQYVVQHRSGSFYNLVGDLISLESASYASSSLSASYALNTLSSSYALTSSYASFTPYIETIGAKITTEDTYITAGSKGYKHISFPCNIIKTRTIANTNGNINVNIRRNGTNLGNISLSNSSSSLDSTLSGWTKQLNTDDLIEFYISGSSLYITDITIFIDIQAR